MNDKSRRPWHPKDPFHPPVVDNSPVSGLLSASRPTAAGPASELFDPGALQHQLQAPPLTTQQAPRLIAHWRVPVS